jgi:glucose-6-phosphate 1-dehydrogenase
MQNHLLQVLTLLAMDRPNSFSAEDIRDEKVRVLKAMSPISPKDVIIGQYGKSLDGTKPSYKEDDTVPKGSRCPTFCSMVAWVKNERWDGVPFILKAGKGMNCWYGAKVSTLLTFLQLLTSRRLKSAFSSR